MVAPARRSAQAPVRSTEGTVGLELCFQTPQPLWASDRDTGWQVKESVEFLKYGQRRFLNTDAFVSTFHMCAVGIFRL